MVSTTACKWDTIIPFEPLWEQYERIIKDNGAIVLTASQPFTSMLVMSNPKRFKYEWIWDKKRSSGALNADVAPLKVHENILIFSDGRTTYNKQMRQGKPRVDKPRLIPNGDIRQDRPAIIRGYKNEHGLYNPISILEVSNASQQRRKHPTQKPVALFEYVIQKYTKEGEIVLDNCIGSGTSCVAAINTGRNYIGIEKEPKYCEIARKRVDEALLSKTSVL